MSSNVATPHIPTRQQHPTESAAPCKLAKKSLVSVFDMLAIRRHVQPAIMLDSMVPSEPGCFRELLMAILTQPPFKLLVGLLLVLLPGMSSSEFGFGSWFGAVVFGRRTCCKRLEMHTRASGFLITLVPPQIHSPYVDMTRQASEKPRVKLLFWHGKFYGQ